MRKDLGRYPIRQPQPSSKHHHGTRLLFFALAVCGAYFGLTHALNRHTTAATPAIYSGVHGYCLDVHDSAATAGSPVGSWQCNGSSAQSWTRSLFTLKYHDTLCLSVQHDATVAGAPIVVDPCTNDAPGQVWLATRGGLENPNSGQCLGLPDGHTGIQLTLTPCDKLGGPAATWSSSQLATDACPAAKGPRIACMAAKEWGLWQSDAANHTALLTAYTDGAPYEAWCADFVSYIYKEAGYAFTGGEADGWDESNANNIQNMGFTMHSPDSYTPKPGDIAYFDYDGGHVEIVASGGKTPTFIYGNSGTTDPTTDNGQMAANTITQDGTLGSLQYYLSPN